MNNKLLTLLPFATSCVFLLSSMGSPSIASSDPDFGCSVRSNINIQTVDLDPKYEGKLMEGGVGTRSASAVRRYMTDKVRPLVQLDGRSEVGGQGGAQAPAGGGGMAGVQALLSGGQ